MQFSTLVKPPKVYDNTSVETVEKLAAERIRSIRTIRGLTQEEAARRIGVNQRTWANVESGRKSIHLGLLKRIADALDAPIGYFVNASYTLDLIFRETDTQAKKLSSEEQAHQAPTGTE